MSVREYSFALAVEREKLMRTGKLKPINLDEERQLAEGPRAPSELDCVQSSMASQTEAEARSKPKTNRRASAPTQCTA